MISIIKKDNIKITKGNETVIGFVGELRGKSTDTKPTTFEGKVVGNGSIFIEIDTGKIFFYDAESEKWNEV